MDTKEMKTLTLNEQSYEIVDEAAREDISALQTQVGYYGVCNTSEAYNIKTVTVGDGFTLQEGANVRVKFTYGGDDGSNGTVCLNVNNTGNIEVRATGVTGVPIYYWGEEEVVEFTYNGVYWLMNRGAIATTNSYGVTKLSDSVSNTSTDVAATSNAVKQAYDKAADAANDIDTMTGEIAEIATNLNGVISTANTNAANISSLQDDVSELNSNALIARGTLSNDVDLDDVKATTGDYEPGIYKLEGYTFEPLSVACWGVLVLFPYYDVQLVIVWGGRAFTRDYTGNPVSWANWNQLHND